MITNPTVGMRVRGKSIASDYVVRDRVGIIIEVRPIMSFDFMVRLDHNGNTWWCHCPDFDHIPRPPEEEAQFLKEQERALDQQRRLEHAMKYF